MQFKSFMESLTTEEKTIEVTMKSGHKFTAPIKVTHKDWHIVKHPVSGKQYRVDHKGNTLEEEVELQEEHVVHVDDGSKYGDQPHQKDADHVMAGVKKHNGKFDGHSDKGAYFKFSSKSDAKNFVDHVKRAPHKTVYADLHEEVELDEADVQARADYKLDKNGRKYHKQIAFRDGSNDEANEKNEVREETEMNEEMTDAQKVERERIVKGMKKNIAGFKAKYGERAKEVMYATATKQAMKEETLEEGADQHKVVVTVSDPNHTMVSQRKEQQMKRVIVKADNREHAVTKAKEFYKKKGYKVHDAEYHSAQPKSSLKTEEATLDEAQYGVNLGSRPVSGQKEYQGKEIKSFHPNKEKEAREFADKHGYVVKKNMLPAGNSITHTWDIHKEEVEQISETPVTKAKQPYRPGSIDPATGKTREAPRGTMAYDKAQREKKLKEELEQEAAEVSEGYRGNSEADKPFFDAQDHKKAAEKARKSGDHFSYHKHMSAHHDAMEHWSNNKGRTHVANQHAMKADEHEDYAQQARLKKEQFSIDEEGNLMFEKLTYAQFMEQLYVTIEEAKDDYWDFKDLKDEPKSTTRKVSGTRYGGSAQKDDPEDDEHAKKSSEPAVKRGRGRPAGSKSGANQKVTSGKSYGGIATHSLHLPNSNR